MQSLSSSLPAATPSSVSAPVSVTLLAAFVCVPDPRRPHGRRFPLAAVLALAVTPLLANHLSVLAIAQWGKRQSPAVLPHSASPRVLPRIKPRSIASSANSIRCPSPGRGAC